MIEGLEYLYGLGMKRRQVAESLGVSVEAVSSWGAGRSSPSACVHGAVEAIRVLEAGLGREKTLALILGHPPQRWMVAVAALAAACGATEGSDGACRTGTHDGGAEPAAPVLPAPAGGEA